MTPHPDSGSGRDNQRRLLSATEMSRLDEISAHLHADDPDLAAFLSSGRLRRDRPGLRRRALLGALGGAILILTALVVLSIHLMSPALFFLSGPPLALTWIAVFRCNRL